MSVIMIIIFNYIKSNKICLYCSYNKKEDAQKAINQLNGVLLEGCTEHLSVKIAEEHGKQKAAYLAGLQTGLAHRGTNDTLTYLSY